MRRTAARIASVLALPLLVAGAPSAVAGQGTAALQAASERFAAIETICADFVQVMEITLLRQTKNSAGTVCQRRPNLFSMRYSQPAGDEIVADGTHFWVHQPSEAPGQVIRIPMASQPGGLDFYRELLERPMEKYEVTEAGSETIEDVPTVAVKLVPRRATEWRDATVWIDPATSMIRRARIVETNGTVRTLTLSAIRVDPALAADFFEYHVPDGATVVTMGGDARP